VINCFNQQQLGFEPLQFYSCCPLRVPFDWDFQRPECVCAAACAGDPIRLSDCTGSGNQRWFMDASSRLRPYHAPAKCLDVRNGALVAVRVSALDLATLAALMHYSHCICATAELPVGLQL
jgi:hypothetical protein